MKTSYLRGQLTPYCSGDAAGALDRLGRSEGEGGEYVLLYRFDGWVVSVLCPRR